MSRLPTRLSTSPSSRSRRPPRIPMTSAGTSTRRSSPASTPPSPTLRASASVLIDNNASIASLDRLGLPRTDLDGAGARSRPNATDAAAARHDRLLRHRRDGLPLDGERADPRCRCDDPSAARSHRRRRALRHALRRDGRRRRLHDHRRSSGWRSSPATPRSRRPAGWFRSSSPTPEQPGRHHRWKDGRQGRREDPRETSPDAGLHGRRFADHPPAGRNPRAS